MAGIQIRVASSDADYAAFGSLITQYLEWTRGRYHDDLWFINEVFGYQSLDSEIQNLRRVYGSPHGKTLLAFNAGTICGAGAYRKLADGSCEMKRLFVPDAFHGMGVGRALCEALVSAARADGFMSMKLDTARRLVEAIALYTRQGFQQCPAYASYPESLMPYLIFMELDLSTAP